MEGIVLVGIVVLFVLVLRQHGRLSLLERQVAALRRNAAESAPLDAPAAVRPAGTGAASDASAKIESPPPAVLPRTAADRLQADDAGPWGRRTDASGSADAAPAARPVGSKPARRKRDIETALGTRWAVWIGGLALALGGLFLVRYSIEAGIFGPRARLAMAAMLGVLLGCAGEFVRRTGFRLPVEGAAGAYVPGILTAAGAFTLFGTVYAAHGIYGFLGPAAAFVLLGMIGTGTIALALVHGQALAGVGLVGSMATPLLVSSQAPNAWALFGYLAIVLAAGTAIARLRDWVGLAAAGFAGVGLWITLYLLPGQPVPDLAAVLFINAVMLVVLALIWLRSRPPAAAEQASTVDWPSVVPAFFAAIAAMRLMAGEDLQPAGGTLAGAALLVVMLLIALYRDRALPLLHAAGLATLLVHASAASSGWLIIDLAGGAGFSAQPLSPFIAALRPAGTVLAVAFLLAGLWQGSRLVTHEPERAAHWSGWGVVVPLLVLSSLWVVFGNLDRDLLHAVLAAGLAAAFVASGEFLARRERPPLAGGVAVSLVLAGAGVAAMLMLHMAFGSLWTTVLTAVAAMVPAFATRLRRYPVLGWLSVAAAAIVLCRIALDPTIVGAAALGTTPVFNVLLPGYGVPALAFTFAAWQLARTTAGRPRLAMEAAAALFSLLTLAMLVRHAMHGGVIDTAIPTLAEQAIYTLIALGAGAILIAIDQRSPSPVLRLGSIAVGVLSAGFVIVQHFVFLNPLFTDESTGRIVLFNLLFLAYLLPAVSAGGLALLARGRRPHWYCAMLGLLASALAFFYATLSVRRLFQGEHLGYWAGMGQLETWSYSALWLAMGVGLLVAGVRVGSYAVRVASAVLIAVAVAKVFIFDMSELEGVLRALSFIGLGAVLIGIGLFYQRLLTGRRKPAAAEEAAPG